VLKAVGAFIPGTDRFLNSVNADTLLLLTMIYSFFFFRRRHVGASRLEHPWSCRCWAPIKICLHLAIFFIETIMFCVLMKMLLQLKVQCTSAGVDI